MEHNLIKVLENIYEDFLKKPYEIGDLTWYGFALVDDFISILKEIDLYEKYLHEIHLIQISQQKIDMPTQQGKSQGYEGILYYMQVIIEKIKNNLIQS